jgi:hypothetical protein
VSNNDNKRWKSRKGLGWEYQTHGTDGDGANLGVQPYFRRGSLRALRLKKDGEVPLPPLQPFFSCVPEKAASFYIESFSRYRGALSWIGQRHRSALPGAEI